MFRDIPIHRRIYREWETGFESVASYVIYLRSDRHDCNEFKIGLISNPSPMLVGTSYIMRRDYQVFSYVYDQNLGSFTSQTAWMRHSIDNPQSSRVPMYRKLLFPIIHSDTGTVPKHIKPYSRSEVNFCWPGHPWSSGILPPLVNTCVNCYTELIYIAF
jgi:hypothetical protein